MFLEKSVAIGTVDTKIDEGNFKEGGSFVVPEVQLPTSPINFSLYQDLLDALVGSKFSIDYGALDNDILLKIFIRNLDPDVGTYLNMGIDGDTLFSYFEIRIWELPDSIYYPEETSYYLNEGYYARFSIPKSEAFLTFTQEIGIEQNDSLAFAFMENFNGGDEQWNGFGIETLDTPDSVTFKAVHLSRIGGGKRRIASNIINPDSLVSAGNTFSSDFQNIFQLRQNYPNPFNPSTKISYSLNKAGDVSLQIYNILGQPVHTLINEFQNPGNYEINFSVHDIKTSISSGIYFIQLKQNGLINTKKMVLTK
jgi:hypothetical protein